MERLKDKPNFLIPNPGQCLIVHESDIFTIQPVLPSRWPTQTPQDIQQGRLATPRLSDNGHKLTFVDRDFNLRQGMDAHLAGMIDL